MPLTYLSQVWLLNITYIGIGIGLVYPAELLDAYSRKVISHDASITLDATVIFEVTKMAIARGQPGHGVTHRSDRGVQYASGGYVDELYRSALLISMARTGDPYDNAVAPRLAAPS